MEPSPRYCLPNRIPGPEWILAFFFFGIPNAWQEDVQVGSTFILIPSVTWHSSITDVEPSDGFVIHQNNDVTK